MKKDIIVGLDIGTTKILMVMGYMGEDGEINVCSYGKGPSTGVEYGLVFNLQKTIDEIGIALFLWAMPETAMRYSVESLMLALLCPTATACAVVTQKLGGDAAPTTSYTIMINIAISILAPLLLPIAHPQTGMSFFPAFITIMCKVFPLLIMPLVAAWGVRYYMPALHKRILATRDLAFYMWAVALALAITVSCRALVNSHAGVWNISGIALATLIACAFQFIVGKRIGKTYGTTIECGQALGQKNTIFLIWMGYTFLSPVTAIAGGFYSIWQNSFNSYQLYKYRKKA